MDWQNFLQWAAGIVIAGLAWALRQHKEDAKEKYDRLVSENEALNKDFSDLSLKVVQDYIRKEEFTQYRLEVRQENSEFRSEMRQIVNSIGQKIDQLKDSIAHKADRP